MGCLMTITNSNYIEMANNSTNQQIFTNYVSYSGGTNSGYDTKSGVDSICWMTSSESSTAGQNDNNRKMLSECLPALNLEITHRPSYENLTEDEGDGDESWIKEVIREKQFVVEQSYDFHIKLRIDSLSTNLFYKSNEPDSINYDENGIFARILICNMEEVGFCSPLAVSNSETSLFTFGDSSFATDFIEMDHEGNNDGTSVYNGVVRTSIQNPGSYSIVGQARISGDAFYEGNNLYSIQVSF